MVYVGSMADADELAGSFFRVDMIAGKMRDRV
jgi:hypothetical protein